MSLAWKSYCSKFKKTKDYFFSKLFFFHCRMHFPPFVKVHTAALLPISGIMLNEKLHWKLSKFATFYEYKMSELIFPFFISCYALYFLLVNILVYVKIEAFITVLEKTKYSTKGKHQLWVFVSYKIWQILKCFSSIGN